MPTSHRLCVKMKDRFRGGDGNFLPRELPTIVAGEGRLLSNLVSQKWSEQKDFFYFSISLETI